MPHVPPRVGMRISVPDCRSASVGAWSGGFRQGFHRRVDRRETLLLVCSLARMEVAGKGCRR